MISTHCVTAGVESVSASSVRIFGTNYAFSQLRQRVDKADWVRHGRPAVVNAFYSPVENSIQVQHFLLVVFTDPVSSSRQESCRGFSSRVIGQST